MRNVCCEGAPPRQSSGRLAEDEPPDDRLLERFLNEGEDAAFEALVRRHGPMVYGVCRRALHDAHEAEDAFQATFLVLVRKLRSLKSPELLANWLYGVAYRVASKAKARMARRNSRNRQMADVAAPSEGLDVEWAEVRSIVDDEMSRLPEKHRAPLVLCYLEGRTHAEAARELGCPAGSMSWRLAQAREAFRKRLSRRGVVLSGALLAVLLSQKAAPAAVSAALVQATVVAARQFVAGGALAGGSLGPASSLSDAVLRGEALKRLTALLTLVLLVVTISGTGAILLASSESAVEWWVGGRSESATQGAPTGCGSTGTDLETGVALPTAAALIETDEQPTACTSPPAEPAGCCDEDSEQEQTAR